MSKYVMGNHVRVTDPSHHDFDQVGEVVDVIRELNRWLYSVRFGIAYVPIPECHLILADQPAAAPAPFAFTFNVEGTAASQGSKKAFIVGGKVNLVEMSKNLPAWRALVTRAAMRAWNRPALDCPVSVQATFRIPKPKSTKFTGYPAGPPDTDKLQRAVGDALQAAGVLSNDSRIVHWDASKVWGPAGATITITEMRTP